MTLKSEYLDPIADTALFYPCCGDDLQVPIRLFASAVSDFYFVDLNVDPCLPELVCIANLRSSGRAPANADVFLLRATGREFRVHRRQRDGEEAVADITRLGVFFYRGDYAHGGEGSGGVLWLGAELFSRVLRRLVLGGFVVTDGSNSDDDGPRQLSRFYHDSGIRDLALSTATPFTWHGRKFTCVGYAGERYGPTLIWRVT